MKTNGMRRNEGNNEEEEEEKMKTRYMKMKMKENMKSCTPLPLLYEETENTILHYLKKKYVLI